MDNKVILTTTNIDALEINNEILDKLPGEKYTYYSLDTAHDQNSTNLDELIPDEFIHSLTPNGLPQHQLTLKLGAIVYLLRNLNINAGLYNGTRLKITRMQKFNLLCEIIVGARSGEKICLPRLDFSPDKNELPFVMNRRQFPIRLGYCITINRAQGQSFDAVGIVLNDAVFSHGQLYVALTRSHIQHSIKVCLKHDDMYPHTKDKKKTQNIIPKILPTKKYLKVNFFFHIANCSNNM